MLTLRAVFLIAQIFHTAVCWRINYKSAAVLYVDDEYLDIHVYEPRQFNRTYSSMFTNVTLKKELGEGEVTIEGYILRNNSYGLVFNTTYKPCDMFAHLDKIPLLHRLLEEVQRNDHKLPPPHCPVKPGNYYAYDVRFKEDLLPAFVLPAGGYKVISILHHKGKLIGKTDAVVLIENLVSRIQKARG